MSDAEIRDMIAELTDDETREILSMLRELKRCIEERHHCLYTDSASVQPIPLLAASW